MAQQVRPWLTKPENGRAPIECAKADGGQPAEPIRDSGPRAASKVRMYGCNRNLSAASREEKPGARLGASMYLRSERADIHGGQPRSVWERALYRSFHPGGP